MLTQLYISDYAIIDRMELEFGPGMTALTGETGAGKSILIGALGLVLGDRADSTSLREGAERAEIVAGFDIEEMPQVAQWLQARDLDAQGECGLRRILTKDGPSRAYINGRPVPVQLLKELGEQLVDIYGQRDHQSLLRPEIQRRLLDEYGRHGKLLDQLGQLAREWHAADHTLTELRTAQQNRDEKLEVLSFQAQELADLALQPGEVEQLSEEHGRLANADNLVEGGQGALERLYDREEASAYSLISSTLAELEKLSHKDQSLNNVVQMLRAGLIQIQECVDELRHYCDGLERDPERLQWVEQRLGTIRELSRKHRLQDAELPALTDQLQAELDTLRNADRNLEELEAKLARITKRYNEIAESLSASRRRAAADISRRVTKDMRELGMSGGCFEAKVQPLENRRFSAQGMDRIEFLVNANPGQSKAALTKVASGGELSRISLAIQVIAADSAHIPVLVFDEVDTGIGGAIAEVVGSQLRQLGGSHQVLCITHLPQVAAQADKHLQLTKLTGKKTTRTRIRKLSETERVDEIARMLGGRVITASSLVHAREMIQGAKSASTKNQKKSSGKAGLQVGGKL